MKMILSISVYIPIFCRPLPMTPTSLHWASQPSWVEPSRSSLWLLWTLPSLSMDPLSCTPQWNCPIQLQGSVLWFLSRSILFLSNLRLPRQVRTIHSIKYQFVDQLVDSGLKMSSFASIIFEVLNVPYFCYNLISTWSVNFFFTRIPFEDAIGTDIFQSFCSTSWFPFLFYFLTHRRSPCDRLV